MHCRLVMEKDGASPWQLRYGPFDESDFLELPKTHYSLLVSECEKWIPELGDLLDAFRFIMNDERMDDIPLVLETIDDSIWAQEIELLYSLQEK